MKHSKHCIHRVLLFVALSLFMLLPGCKQSLDYLASAKKDAKTASLRVQFGSDARGAVIPNFATVYDKIELTLKKGSLTQTQTFLSNPVNGQINGLETGTWTITAKAMKTSGAEVATGSASMNLVAGTNTVNVPLVFNQILGQGSLALEVRFPTSLGVTSVTAELIGQTGVTLDVTLPATVDGNPAISKIIISNGVLDGGRYDMKMTFKKVGSNVVELGAFIESVNIWSGAESNKWLNGEGGLATYLEYTVGDFISYNTALESLTVDSGEVSYDSASQMYTVLTTNDSVKLTPKGAELGQFIQYKAQGASDWTAIASNVQTANLTAGLHQIKVRAPNRRDAADYTVIVHNLKPTMIEVPSGTFQRDATAANKSFVSSFKISSTEISRAQYKDVMGTDPSVTSVSSSMADPVQKVSWYDAVEFCNKLSQIDSKTPFYTMGGRTPATGYPITSATVTVADWSADGYRLPTEMEWMWAAIGADATVADITMGGVNTVGYTKPYAGFVDGSPNTYQYVWYSANSGAKTHPVGLKAGNQLGLFDMSGNVWEWCWDGYKTPLDVGMLADYYGDPTSSSRSTKGGAFTTSNVDLLKPANRNSSSATTTANDLGFRVAQSVGGGTPPSITFDSLTADGSADQTTRTLTLTFDQNPEPFSIDNISINGATTVALIKESSDLSGKTWKLAIKNIEVDDSSQISVNVVNHLRFGLDTSRAVAVRWIPAVGLVKYEDRNPVGVVFWVGTGTDAGKYKVVSVENVPPIVVTTPPGQLSWHKDSLSSLEIAFTSSAEGKINLANFKSAANTAGKIYSKENYPAMYSCEYWDPATKVVGPSTNGWYLPSIDELRNLFNNKIIVDDALDGIAGTRLDLGAGQERSYWSSTPFDDSRSLYINFYAAGQSFDYGRYGTCYVRAIKAYP